METVSLSKVEGSENGFKREEASHPSQEIGTVTISSKDGIQFCTIL